MVVSIGIGLYRVLIVIILRLQVGKRFRARPNDRSRIIYSVRLILRVREGLLMLRIHRRLKAIPNIKVDSARDDQDSIIRGVVPEKVSVVATAHLRRSIRYLVKLGLSATRGIVSATKRVRFVNGSGNLRLTRIPFYGKIQAR